VGVSKSVYVGPYFEVSYPKESEDVDHCRNRDECPDKSGEESRRSIPNSWCSKCGIKLGVRFKFQSFRVDFIEVFDGQERLISIKDDDDEDDGDMYTDFLIANLGGSATPRLFMAEYSHEIDREARKSEKGWLCKNFESELDILRQRFGYANVYVCWGVLVWWS
jgi:hypothetical protein